MSALTKGLIVLGCVVVIGVGGVVLFEGQITRALFPQLYVARAIANTVSIIVPPPTGVPDLAREIFQDSWQQQLTMGVSRLEGTNLPPQLTPEVMAALQMLALRNNIAWNEPAQAWDADISLQMAVTTIIGASLHLEQERIAFNVPQLFDYYITANADNAIEEWNNSLLGQWLTRLHIDEDIFRHLYNYILFYEGERLELHSFAEITAPLMAALQNADFSYIGQQELITNKIINTSPIATINETQTVSAFEITLPTTYADESFRLLRNNVIRIYNHIAGYSGRALFPEVPGSERDLSASENTIITVYVSNERLAGVDFEGGTVRFHGENGNEISFEVNHIIGTHPLPQEITLKGMGILSNDDGHIYQQMTFEFTPSNIPGVWPAIVDWHLDWNPENSVSDNFTIALGFDSPGYLQISTGAEGFLRNAPSQRGIESNFRRLYLAISDDGLGVEDLDVVLNTRHLLRPATERDFQGLDTNNIRPITNINLLNMLAMVARLQSLPIVEMMGGIGGLLG